MGSGEKTITVGQFAQWGLQCARDNIEFLLVLDACYSTIFASSVRTRMLELAGGILNAAQCAFAEKHVGFITSARSSCARSIAMISTDESLVNLFGAKSPEEEWARGFLHRSTMFLRQFNWLLAYGFGTFAAPLDRDVNLSQFVVRMNMRCLPAGHGFHASLVADEGFGSIPLRSFFPFPRLGNLRPDQAMAAWPEVMLEDLIPSARLGRLFDDVGTLEGAGVAEGDEKVAEEEAEEQGGTFPADYLLIPIRRAGDNTVERAGATILSSQLVPESPIVQRLSGNEVPGADEDEEEDNRPKGLQANHLLLVMLRKITNGRIKFTNGHAVVTSDICHLNELAQYLEEDLQVSVPLWEPLGRVAGFRSCFATDEQFRDFLQQMLARALARFPEFQQMYPDIPPLSEDE
jgi:hypothetical protein